MESKNKKKDILEDIQNFEQNLHLKGSINLNNNLREDQNIFERLGLSTSINSVIKELESDSKIKVLSPFSNRQEPNKIMQPSNLGVIGTESIAQTPLNPALKRIRFISNLLIRALIIAIIINFILIFIL